MCAVVNNDLKQLQQQQPIELHKVHMVVENMDSNQIDDEDDDLVKDMVD
jgi:hypothetical protein